MIMPKVKYLPMPNARLSATQAQTVGKELQRISKQKGCLKPALIVEAARPPESSLHAFFTWDDTEAAEQWRETQARGLVRSVRIVQCDMPSQEQPVIRAFVSVQASDTETKFEGHAYLPIQVATKSEDYKKQILDAAMSELREWKRRYSDYQQYFSSIFSAIEELEMV